MNKAIHICMIVAAIAAAQRAEAATYTNYLDDASNVVSQAYGTTEGKTHARLGTALAAFNKESSSVAGDYNILYSFSTQLLPLLKTPGLESISPALSNAVYLFVIEGEAELETLNARLEALPPYINARPASNQVAQAERAILTPSQTTDVRKILASVRLAYAKIGVADKLLTKAESLTGFAPDSLAGLTLTHREPGDSGTITFIDEGNYTDDSGGGTYSYTRSGLNTGTMIGIENEDGGTTTVQFRFTSSTKGTFFFRYVNGNDRDSGFGTFTVSATNQ